MPASLPTALLTRAAGLLGAAGVLACGVLAVTQAPPPRPATDEPCALGAGGFFRGQFFGALSLTADWSGPGLACDGMQRPSGDGIRLYFSGGRPGGGRVAVVIGLEGQPGDLAGAERPANVTVIDERDGRFFSSAGPGRCWASVASVTPVVPLPGRPAGSRIAGLAYCVGALPSLGDRTSLTLGDLRFSGWVAASEE